jgi:microcystin-dependent protein
MAQPYIGEIRMFAGNFAPAGWMFCNGQLLPISEYDALFILIGTTYGGDGQDTFGLPNLQSRLPMHAGTGPGLGTYTLGEMGGVESVTLSTNQIPVHSHALLASTGTGDQISPSGNVLATSFNVAPYINDIVSGNLNAAAVGPVGGSQPHSNLQPYLCVNFIISLFGIYPNP